MIDLDKHNPTPKTGNLLNYGFFLINLGFDGKVSVYKNPSIHFTGAAQANGHNVFDSFPEAIEKVKQWSTYVWNNNNQDELIKDHNLTRNFVEQFLRHTFPCHGKG